MKYNIDTPILFIIFNRPDLTKLVFERVRQHKPRKLYVCADGANDPINKELCKESRDIIINNIDWNCELKTAFRENNLGCKKSVSDAITWFFNNESEGIILEDDCLPSDSFFGFCSQMLEKYRYDEHIGHIAGSNFQLGNIRGDGSYYFSNLTHVWGWAGWSRVWKDYDVDMKHFPEFKDLELINMSDSHKPYKNHWLHCLEETYFNRINTWDYQYAFLNLRKKKISIIPNVNLISNIGFREDATHTKENHKFSNLKSSNIDKIIHPTDILADVEADLFTQRIEYTIPQKIEVAKSKKKNFLSRTWRAIKSFRKDN